MSPMQCILINFLFHSTELWTGLIKTVLNIMTNLFVEEVGIMTNLLIEGIISLFKGLSYSDNSRESDKHW